MTTALTTQPAFPGGQELTDMRNAAALIAQSALVPEAFRGKPADIMVAILTARGLGLDPMVALQKGYVVKGRFDVEVSVKLGLIQSRLPDFDYEVIVLDDDRCVVEGGRAGKNKARSEFTYLQAVAAGLTTGKYGPTPTWQFYRRDMLLNRALGRVLKLTCAAALYNMPVMLDEPDFADDNNATTVAPVRPASGAEVVEDGPATPAPTPPPAQVVEASQPVPVDWKGRLLRAVAACYKRTPPGTHKNSYQAWAKANMEQIMFLANAFYQSVGEPEVKGWISVPPMDCERIALWVEARNEKREGTEGLPSGGTDAAPSQAVEDAGNTDDALAGAPVGASMAAPPASEAEPLVEDDGDDRWPESEPEAEPGYVALSKRGPDVLVTVLLRCRAATKNLVAYVLKAERSGRYQITHSEILKSIGSVTATGTAQSMWLVDAAKNDGLWLMLCRAVADEATRLKVDYLN